MNLSRPLRYWFTGFLGLLGATWTVLAAELPSESFLEFLANSDELQGESIDALDMLELQAEEGQQDLLDEPELLKSLTATDSEPYTEADPKPGVKEVEK